MVSRALRVLIRDRVEINRVSLLQVLRTNVNMKPSSRVNQKLVIRRLVGMLTNDENVHLSFIFKKMTDVFEEGQGGVSVLETGSHCTA